MIKLVFIVVKLKIYYPTLLNIPHESLLRTCWNSLDETENDNLQSAISSLGNGDW